MGLLMPPPPVIRLVTVICLTVPADGGVADVSRISSVSLPAGVASVA